MLFKDVDDLKRYLAGNQQQMADETIMPFVEQAQIRYLVPVIGPELLAELDQAYNAGPDPEADPLSDAYTDLIKLLQRSLAYYALLDAIPFLNVRVGDTGLQEASSGNSMPVRQWSYNEIVKATADNADVFLEHALLYLEKNSGEFSNWSESEYYTISKELFINNAGELSRFLNTQGSRKFYLAIRPFLVQAEDIYIRPALGENLFDSMKDLLQAEDDNPTRQQEELLKKIQKALAQWAFYLALPEVNFVSTAFGLKLQTESLASSYKSSISDEQTAALRLGAEQKARLYTSEIRKYLDQHTENFEDYQPDPDERPRYQVPDNSDKPSFRV